MKLFYCQLENSSNVKIWLLLNSIAYSLSRITNTDGMKEEDILNCKFRVKPSLFRVFGKKGKAIAIDQERKFFVIEIACPGINNYDNGGFSFFFPKFKISSSFRIEAWTTDSGILRLLVEQVDSSDSQFGILVKTGAICFAFSFDIRKQIISDVQTIYMTGNFKILDVQTVLGLPNIAHEDSFRKK